MKLQLPHSLTLALLQVGTMLAVTLSLTADSVPTRRFQVYFLGESAPGFAEGFENFKGAVRKFQPQLFSLADIHYVEVSLPAKGTEASLREIARRKPDAVVAISGDHARVARRALPDFPLIFSSYDDPLSYGIVSHPLKRPEPACGISLLDTLEGPRFEILQQAFPKIQHIYVLADEQWALNTQGSQRTALAAQQIGIPFSLLLAENMQDVSDILKKHQPRHNEAWYIPASTVTDHSANTLIQQFRAWHVPSMWTQRSEISLGAPLAYSQEADFVWRSLADLTARVHAGENAGSIPILRPTRFKLMARVEPDSPIPPPQMTIVKRADLIVRQ